MAQKRLRSESWWNDPSNPGMTALYLERFLNYGMTAGELVDHRTDCIPFREWAG
jgi:dihydroxy-acid dehydratase